MADAILIGSDIKHCEKSVEVGLMNAGMCFNGVHLEIITVSRNWVFIDCNWNIYCSAAPSVLRIITVTSELQRRENTGSWKLSLAYLCGVEQYTSSVGAQLLSFCGESTLPDVRVTRIGPLKV